MSSSTFSDRLAMAAQILKARFGHDSFRHPQQAVIERTLMGGHSMVIVPTGGGKSICFQIPAEVLRATWNGEGLVPITVVLSPLIALMKDQVDGLVAKGASATFINSSLDRAEREDRYTRLQNGEFSLLYVTPERFRKPDFVAALANRQVVLLAIDEAHCVSQWGHDFRPDYSNIVHLRSVMGNPVTMFLTATATADVQADILVQSGIEGFGSSPSQCTLFREGIDRPNLRLEVEPVWGRDEKLDHIERIVRNWQADQAVGKSHLSSPGIVYFTLIKTLCEFSDALRRRGIPHVCYHGDLDRQQRKRIQDDFMKGRSPLVLATNAFGMGVDKEDIRFVIHADVPGSLESYYQEIGRAGRDGKPSQCVLLYDQDDLMTQMQFVQASNPDADFYCRVYNLLKHDGQSVRAFGIEWLHKQLCDRNKHDRRLETVLSMFHRFGLIDDPSDLSTAEVTEPLPETLSSKADRDDKRVRDQKRLYALVEYIQAEDRQAFLRGYFA